MIQQIKLDNMATSLVEVIKKMEPNLYNLTLYYDDVTRYFDVYHYLNYDPRRNELGYRGQIAEEFVMDSPMWGRLTLIEEILYHWFNLKWESEP